MLKLAPRESIISCIRVAVLRILAVCPLVGLCWLAMSLLISFESLPTSSIAIAGAAIVIPFLVAPAHLALAKELSHGQKVAWAKVLLSWRAGSVFAYLLTSDRANPPHLP